MGVLGARRPWERSVEFARGVSGWLADCSVNYPPHVCPMCMLYRRRSRRISNDALRSWAPVSALLFLILFVSWWNLSWLCGFLRVERVHGLDRWLKCIDISIIQRVCHIFVPDFILFFSPDKTNKKMTSSVQIWRPWLWSKSLTRDSQAEKRFNTEVNRHFWPLLAHGSFQYLHAACLSLPKSALENFIHQIIHGRQIGRVSGPFPWRNGIVAEIF